MFETEGREGFSIICLIIIIIYLGASISSLYIIGNSYFGAPMKCVAQSLSWQGYSLKHCTYPVFYHAGELYGKYHQD